MNPTTTSQIDVTMTNDSLPAFLDRDSEKLVGLLVNVQIYGGGWGRGTVRTDDLVSVTVTGSPLSGLEISGRYEFTGKVVVHPVYGLQFQAVGACLDIPLHRESLIKHLRKAFNGVGEVTARKLVELHEENGTLEFLRDSLVRDPFSIDFTPVTKRVVAADVTVGIPEMIYRDLSTRFGAISNNRVMRSLSNWLAELVTDSDSPIQKAWEIFSTNPYRPIREVDGYAFLGADAIGRQLSYPPDSPARLAAMVTHALDEGCMQSGHTFLTRDQLIARIHAFDPGVVVDSAVLHAIAYGEPIEEEGGNFYLSWLLNNEKSLARMLFSRIENRVNPMHRGTDHDLDVAINMAQTKFGFTQDESQRQALKGILTSTHSIHTVTAGPGCGKTAIIEVLVEAVGNARKFAFCAPTGKAAKVLSGRIARWGIKASTIHSLLQVTQDGFKFNADNLLPVDIIIADETSMDDLPLMTALVSALPLHAHIIFLGDTKQLPSVGPGNCLADLLQLPFDHHRLTKTHRNDGGILEVVNMAGNGHVDNIDRDDVTFSGSLPEPTEAGISMVLEEYLASLRQCDGDMSKVGLVIARRKGNAKIPGWNSTYINGCLKNTLNPNGRRVTGSTLAVGDRIIIRANQSITQGKGPDGEPVVEIVVNGDTGFIRDFWMSKENKEVDFLELELDDGRTIRYPGATIDAINLAYAMTVHASQGSEYARIIFICVNGSPSFIHCGIMFTAFSRAKKHLRVIGDPRVLQQVARRPIPHRNSGLTARFSALSRASS